MTTAIRIVLSAAKARRTARHMAGVRFCDSRARISDSAARAAEIRARTQLTALMHAR
ncbi:hypothetical protein [Streptomyces sp. Tu 2975]|uniref:hypothetical protein n=1 Tax=Streptomyces sp. Tu 2975 TaxID=2676871 RepID=UPI001FC9CE6C|nr:hypothetical protein [Streptomyces sp. Tu 2975]